MDIGNRRIVPDQPNESQSSVSVKERCSEEIGHESKLLSEISSFEHLVVKLSNGEEAITSLHQGLAILNKAADLKANLGNDISNKLSHFIDSRMLNSDIMDGEKALLHLQQLYNQLLADEILLTSIVLGPDVRVQTLNELTLWQSDKHTGISTRKESEASVKEQGTWLIFFSVKDQRNVFLQMLKGKIAEVNLNSHAKFSQVETLATLNRG